MDASIDIVRRIVPATETMFLVEIPPFWAPASSIAVDFTIPTYFGLSYSQISCLRSTAAYAVDTSGNWSLFPINTPRITNSGLLSEETRINTVFFSNDITTTGVKWTADNLALTDAQSSPDSGTTASLVTDNTSTITHRVISTDATSFVSGGTYTMSVFAKLGGANPAQYLQLTFPSAAFGVSQYATFDIIAGVVTGSTTGGAASIITYSNGWKRLVFSAVATVSTTGQGFVLSGNPANSNSRSPSYTGTSQTYFLWAPQCEAGTFVTSLILTTTNAAVTRDNDVISIISPPVFGSSYTMLVSGIPLVPASDASSRTWISFDDGTTNNTASILRAATTGVADETNIVGGVGGAVPATGVVLARNTLFKGAFALTAGDQGAAFNGVSASAAAAAVTAPTQIHLGIRADAVNSTQVCSYISRIAIWPNTRLTNAQIQAMTV